MISVKFCHDLNSDNKTANIYVKNCRFNTGLTMTPIKCRKLQKICLWYLHM